MPEINVNSICSNNQRVFHLKNNNFDEENNQMNALTASIIYNNFEIFQILLNNIKVDKNCNLFYRRIKSNQNNTKSEIIEKKTPLFIAVKMENCQILKELIENENVILSSKASREFNSISNSKKTTDKIEYINLMYFAVDIGQIEVVEALLSNSKIDINDITVIHDYVEQFEEHKTAFQLAIEQKNANMIILLQNNKAEIRFERI